MTGIRAAGPGPDDTSDAEHLALIQAEIRFELDLLHQRVNALLAAEAFLTIAYTAAMSNGAAWGLAFARVAAPVLSGLGLILALLVIPGVAATVRIVLSQTARKEQVLLRLPGHARAGFHGVAGGPSALADQRRSMLFFRAAPVLFAVAWTALLVLALVLL